MTHKNILSSRVNISSGVLKVDVSCYFVFARDVLNFLEKNLSPLRNALRQKWYFLKNTNHLGKSPLRKLNCKRQSKDLSETSLKSFHNPSSFFVGLEAFSQAIYYISLTSVSSSENSVVYDSHDFCPHDFHL